MVTERFLITDLTRMQGVKVCIAGLLQSRECIRPMLGAEHPTERWILRDRRRPVRPFSILEITRLQPCPNLTAPHLEDWEIAADYRHRGELPPERRAPLLAETAQTDLETLFGAPPQRDHTEGGAWLQQGAGTRSLATLQPREILAMTSSSVEPGKKLRLRFRDDAGVTVSLPVTDLGCRMYVEWLLQEEGVPQQRALEQISADLRAAGAVYLRLGLARGWDEHPDRCYLQVNGIYSFPDYLGGRCYADFIPPPVPVPF